MISNDDPPPEDKPFEEAPRRIFIWRTRPPSHEVTHRGSLLRLELDGLQAFDLGTVAMVAARMGTVLPVKEGALRPSDFIITNSPGEDGGFEVWRMKDLLH